MTQRIIREGTLILCFLTGLFFLIALVTYSPGDPGFSTTGDGGDIENAVGQSGAWIADLLLYLFGFLAYIFPVALGLKVVSLLRQSDQPQEDFSWAMFWLKTTGVILLAIGACALATMHFEIAEDGAQLAGGIIGAMMVEVTVPVFAVVGSTILYFAIFLLGLTITVEISWLRFIDRTGYWTLNLFSASGTGLRDWLAARKEQQDTRPIVGTRKSALDV